MALPEAPRQGAKAQAYANARIGKSMDHAGRCLQFVRGNFGIPASFPTAIAAWDGAKVKHTSRPPKGAIVPVFFRTPSPYRHVAFLRSDGKVITTNGAKIELWSSIDAVAKGFNGPFMGWSEDLNGYDLYDAPKPPAPAPSQHSGRWDSATTKALQKSFGTTQDGKVSGQNVAYKAKNPGLTTGWEWHTGKYITGSRLIAAMQSWLGKDYHGRIDGIAGPEFFKGLQRRYNMKSVDGFISNPSAVILAMQKDLADGKLNQK